VGEYFPDKGALGGYLAQQAGINTETLEITKFTGGYSNLTYLLTLDGGRKLVMRRPPVGANIKSGHDMHREYRLLSALHPAGLRVPEPVLYCRDAGIIGAEFYVMEYADGVILRAGRKTEDIPSAGDMQKAYNALVGMFAGVHGTDYLHCGLGDLGNPENYPERQITGWSKRYMAAKTDQVDAVEKLMGWLNSHIPAYSGAALIHNDFKYDNLVYDAGTWEIRAILDWEMSTIGDPLMDLGCSLGYWVDRDDPDWLIAINPGPTLWPGSPSREQFVQDYALRTGRDPGNAVFYFAYGMFRLAVIAQQIYARYRAGHTSDPKFASLNKVVESCGFMGMQAVERKKIDRLFWT